jgi:dTDP-4-dehydrorhamnose 3,5-epimerase-like enzyme
MDIDHSRTPRLIELPKINDPRGNLTFIESGKHVPFIVQRNYWIYDVPSGMWRDGHAFIEQDELLVALSGSFDVVLHTGDEEIIFHMSRPQIGLYVPRMTWRHIKNFSTNSVALVLTSTAYDENDYISDFEQFMKLSKEQPKKNE